MIPLGCPAVQECIARTGAYDAIVLAGIVGAWLLPWCLADNPAHDKSDALASFPWPSSR